MVHKSQIQIPLITLFSFTDHTYVSLRGFFIYRVDASMIRKLPGPIEQIQLPCLTPSSVWSASVFCAFTSSFEGVEVSFLANANPFLVECRFLFEGV